MMPLVMMPQGKSASITRLCCRDEQKRHLENLGFVVGEQVTVISDIGGNLIVQVKGSRFAISKSMATKIMM